jgi:hypothetical protein
MYFSKIQYHFQTFLWCLKDYGPFLNVHTELKYLEINIDKKFFKGYPEVTTILRTSFIDIFTKLQESK